MRSDQSTCNPPDAIQVNSRMRASWPKKPTSTNAYQDNSAETISSALVNELRAARADEAAEQAGDQAAEQRQKYDRLIHLSPSSD